MLKSGFSETSIEEERHGEPREKQCAWEWEISKFLGLWGFFESMDLDPEMDLGQI